MQQWGGGTHTPVDILHKKHCCNIVIFRILLSKFLACLSLRLCFIASVVLVHAQRWGGSGTSLAVGSSRFTPANLNARDSCHTRPGVQLHYVPMPSLAANCLACSYACADYNCAAVLIYVAHYAACLAAVAWLDLLLHASWTPFIPCVHASLSSWQGLATCI